ncbi:AAA family ATPase domain-containing protein, tetratricopeptide repeat-containing protein [Desulfonema limicola]|uniref:AAA family ATPase domain-containing protein, tetratricopeptide repeat-containing protein n=1 Tax=Desulfonema limicola TaxID=45656 RepID=A0A975BE78_9BACT|nr:AAA family ATPase [Desulfonema limicola]QTA83762.1 AAA family ATPase domain-containing protein, tetratricopeptide repeat-containing protein [Desulfonema limicola]
MPEIPRDKFVGREKEMQVIEKAINSDLSDKNYFRIVNIQGQGGIGKTSILREVKERLKDNNNILTTSIIDFFDIATNTKIGFLDELNSLLPIKTTAQFKEYRKAKANFYEVEAAGITGDVKKDTLAKFFASFKMCYNFIAADKRIVLLIDTFEVVQKKHGEWLVGWLIGLNNTVVIIAGRENEKWQELAVKSAGSRHVDYLELKKMNSNDTKDLLNLSEYGRALPDEEREKLEIISKGLPILLIMAVDREWPPGGIRGGIQPGKEYTEISEKYSLERLQEIEKKDSEKLEKIHKDFKKELIEKAYRIFDIDPIARVILYMSLIYKYLTADMLNYLMPGKTKDEIEGLLNEINKWTFTKHDPRTGSYWLHDLVRDLINEYAWPEIAREEEERKSIYKRIVRYYEEILIEGIKNEKERLFSERKKANASDDKEKESECFRQLINLKAKRQHYQAHQVYYDIMADYEHGIIRYQMQFVYNLWVREKDANVLLQQERDMTLNALKQSYSEIETKLDTSKEKIVFHRKFDQGLSDLESIADQWAKNENLYQYTDILLYQGIANNYKGEHEKAEHIFKETIVLLDSLDKQVRDQEIHILKVWQIKRSQARCYGHLGYCYFQTGRFSESIDEYNKALEYAKGIEIDSERSQLFNDLSYVLCRLGHFERGRMYWQKGFEIREKLLFKSPIALSLNNRGIIEYLADVPYNGKKYSEKALNMFKDISDIRGIGLSSRALGGLLARIGDIESSIEILEKAEGHLEEAEKIFMENGAVPSPFYLAETYDRMALLYEHWARILKDQGGDDKKKYFEKLEDAEKYYNFRTPDMECLIL